MTRGDLVQFGKWLLERRLAQQHVITHMRRWVMRFIQLRATRPGETWQDTLTVYLEDLGSGQYAPWQIRQAADAVTLYCGQFCRQTETEMPPTGFGPGGVPVALPDQVTPRKGADLAPVRVAREAGQAQPGRHGAQGTESQSLSDPVAAAGTRKPGTGAPTAKRDQIPDHPQMLAGMRRILRLRHYAGSTERSQTARQGSGFSAAC